MVRKSFDARKKRLTWVYALDVDTDALLAAGVRNPVRHPDLRLRCLPPSPRPSSFLHLEAACNNPRFSDGASYLPRGFMPQLAHSDAFTTCGPMPVSGLPAPTTGSITPCRRASIPLRKTLLAASE